MTTSFYEYLRRLNEEGPPPPPGGGAPPPGGPPPGGPPGGDPLGGGPPPPGGDPMGGMGGPPGGPGGAGGMRKAINVTTVWDAIRNALGGDAEEKPTTGQPPKPQPAGTKEMKKPRSLQQ